MPAAVLRIPCRNIALILFVTTSVHAAPWFVDADAPGPADGLTWATAFNNPQDALAVAMAGDDIRVARGTYMPNGGHIGDGGFVAGSGAAVATFQLINGVTIEGGYAGFGEDNPDNRDTSGNVTILSGDLSGNDMPVACVTDAECGGAGGLLCSEGFCIIPANNAENSTAVTTGSGTDATTVLNGFTIKGAFGTSGMVNIAGSPAVLDCIFSENISVSGGV